MHVRDAILIEFSCTKICISPTVFENKTLNESLGKIHCSTLLEKINNFFGQYVMIAQRDVIVSTINAPKILITLSAWFRKFLRLNIKQGACGPGYFLMVSSFTDVYVKAAQYQRLGQTQSGDITGEPTQSHDHVQSIQLWSLNVLHESLYGLVFFLGNILIHAYDVHVAEIGFILHKPISVGMC